MTPVLHKNGGRREKCNFAERDMGRLGQHVSGESRTDISRVVEE
jgi:hypothetical protein